MSRSRSLPVLALANLVTAVPAAADTVAVLSVEARDAPESAAQALTDRLREDFAATGHAITQPLDLIEVKLVCGDDVLAACVARAGGAKGADRVVYGTLRGSGYQFEVSLTYLDVASGRVIGAATAHMQADARLDAEADKLFTRLTGLEVPQEASPESAASPPGPEAAWRPAEPEVTPRPPAQRTSPPVADVGVGTEPSDWRRPVGWTALALGAVSAGVGIAFGAVAKSKQDEWEQAQADNAVYDDSIRDIEAAGQSAQKLYIAGLIVGGVAIVAGALLLTGDGDEAVARAGGSAAWGIAF